MTKADLIQKRSEAVQAMRALVNRADSEKRKMTVEEDTRFNQIDADIESYSAEIKKLDKLEKAEELETVLAQTTKPARPDFGTPVLDEAANQAKYDAAFKEYLRLGPNQSLSPDSERILRAAITDNPQTETTTGGGYLIPQGFSNQLEEALKMYGGMLEACEVFNTETGNTLPWPTVDDTANSGRILAINTQVTNTPFVFGQVSFGAFTFVSDQVLVPIQLMQDSYFNLDSFVAKNLGTRLGRILNNKLTVGVTGSGEPNGIVPAATLGKTGASGQTATIIYDDLVDLEHSVDPAYRKGVKTGWMMSDSMLKLIKKLKDSNGRPLWQPGLTASFARGAENSILDYPYSINQDMAAPGTSGSPVVGNKSLLFGDFSKYKIRRVAGGTTVLRLVERYADYLQVGFIGYLRADGNLVDAGTHPIKYYQNAAS